MPITTITLPTAFDIAWGKADAVTGWLTRKEAESLWIAATRLVPADGVIVEVGSFMGRSLTLLAETQRQVIAIDPLEIGMSIAKNHINDETVAGLLSVVERYENVTWIRERSGNAPKPNRIDLLYIDAWHGYPSPLEDYHSLAGGLHAGSLVAFHDYGREPGVTQSVDELEQDGAFKKLGVAGTMYVGECI